MRVDDADLLDEVLLETVEYSPDLKALALRMIHQQKGQLETVATQTGLPLSTLYYWLKQWNEQQRLLKKKLN
ncbi:helix-turn-helix domain-containing protein [Spirosoma utsteinense]|uniref:Transposase-like protein n=1 Tax=Spirosoma utsteinense TaxID=2585773 RepID=A0ABR6WGK2_9BACT|nr:helix-turn-helix domain-containing protein [Spirosoma utsteinense]MBC3789219.1 transposase-like protein [Spirosoma utsteinense]MBC3795147.1 transposase-like protein [Spirosoma utsteinense]